MCMRPFPFALQKYRLCLKRMAHVGARDALSDEQVRCSAAQLLAVTAGQRARCTGRDAGQITAEIPAMSRRLQAEILERQALAEHLKRAGPSAARGPATQQLLDSRQQGQQQGRQDGGQHAQQIEPAHQTAQAQQGLGEHQHPCWQQGDQMQQRAGQTHEQQQRQLQVALAAMLGATAGPSHTSGLAALAAAGEHGPPPMR